MHIPLLNGTLTYVSLSFASLSCTSTPTLGAPQQGMSLHFFLPAVCVAVGWLCHVLFSSFWCAIWRWGWSGRRTPSSSPILPCRAVPKGMMRVIPVCVVRLWHSQKGPLSCWGFIITLIAHIYCSLSSVDLGGGQPGMLRWCGCCSAGGSRRSRVNWSQWLIDMEGNSGLLSRLRLFGRAVWWIDGG